MNLAAQSDTNGQSITNRWRTGIPIVVLAFLSPVLAEVLMGATTLTKLWLLVPQMGVYGVAALMIREVTRRKQRGWGMILLLGIAYAIAEECVILQTSFAPQFFPPAHTASFGWAFGVQWIYLIAMMWYESVFAIVLPIHLTELLFPDRRDESWLDRQGIVISITIFVLSSVGVWWIWRHASLQKYGDSSYQIPWINVVVALAVIAGIVIGTLLSRPRRQSEIHSTRRAWSPWLVGFMAFGHGVIWFVFIALAYIPAAAFQGASPLVPILISIIWAALALLVVRRLTTAQGWNDRHRLALIFGASLASMLGGTLAILAASPIDRIGKLAFDVIAILVFIYLTKRVRQRKSISA